eukprot:3881001-Prymnesium_polylepis.3
MPPAVLLGPSRPPCPSAWLGLCCGVEPHVETEPHRRCACRPCVLQRRGVVQQGRVEQPQHARPRVRSCSEHVASEVHSSREPRSLPIASGVQRWRLICSASCGRHHAMRCIGPRSSKRPRRNPGRPSGGGNVMVSE